MVTDISFENIPGTEFEKVEKLIIEREAACASSQKVFTDDQTIIKGPEEEKYRAGVIVANIKTLYAQA